MQITVVVTGLSETEARLATLGDSFKNFAPEMGIIGEELKSYYGNTVFVSQGQPWGGWPSLAASTVREKARKGYDGRGILERTGAMKDGFYADVTPVSVFVSNHVDYFRYHQQGTGVGGGTPLRLSRIGSLARAYSIGGNGRGRHLPQRQMIGINEPVKTVVRGVIKAGVLERIKAANGRG